MRNPRSAHTAQRPAACLPKPTAERQQRRTTQSQRRQECANPQSHGKHGQARWLQATNRQTRQRPSSPRQRPFLAIRNPANHWNQRHSSPNTTDRRQSSRARPPQRSWQRTPRRTSERPSADGIGRRRSPCAHLHAACRCWFPQTATPEGSRFQQQRAKWQNGEWRNAWCRPNRTHRRSTYHIRPR